MGKPAQAERAFTTAQDSSGLVSSTGDQRNGCRTSLTDKLTLKRGRWIATHGWVVIEMSSDVESQLF